MTFVNPILGEGAHGERLSAWQRQRQSASLPGRLNVPRSKNVLLPSADLFSLYTRIDLRGTMQSGLCFSIAASLRCEHSGT